MKKLVVFPCGTEVVLKISDYKGIITGIIIEDERVTYKIAYYQNGEAKEQLFATCEFIVTEPKKLSIGFQEVSHAIDA